MVEAGDEPRRQHMTSSRADWGAGGIYFITVCTQNRINLFGRIEHSAVIHSPAGSALSIVWQDMPQFNPGLVLDAFVLMPNHLHAIFGLVDTKFQRSQLGGAKNEVEDKGKLLTVPDVVRKFKTYSMRRYAKGIEEENWPSYPGKLWQRGYWSHKITSDRDLELHQQYIVNNPLKWHLDQLNTARGRDSTRPLL